MLALLDKQALELGDYRQLPDYHPEHRSSRPSVVKEEFSLPSVPVLLAESDDETPVKKPRSARQKSRKSKGKGKEKAREPTPVPESEPAAESEEASASEDGDAEDNVDVDLAPAVGGALPLRNFPGRPLSPDTLGSQNKVQPLFDTSRSCDFCTANSKLCEWGSETVDGKLKKASTTTCLRCTVAKHTCLFFGNDQGGVNLMGTVKIEKTHAAQFNGIGFSIGKMVKSVDKKRLWPLLRAIEANMWAQAAVTLAVRKSAGDTEESPRFMDLIDFVLRKPKAQEAYLARGFVPDHPAPTPYPDGEKPGDSDALKFKIPALPSTPSRKTMNKYA